MAEAFELKKGKEKEREDWILSQPPDIQKMIRKFPPNLLYQMDTGNRCLIYSYSEDGTVTVSVTGEYNYVIFSRRVFGIDPDTLVECDLPGSDEKLGDMSEEVASELDIPVKEAVDLVISAYRRNVDEKSEESI